MSRRNLSAGDTIIEVLLAVTVISIVLASTFVIFNRSSKNARQAQERTEAVKVLESQLEQLKSLAKTPSSPLVGVSEAFCLNSAGGITVISSPSFGNDCQRFGSIPGGYRVEITKTAGDLYRASAVWDAVTGSGQDRASLLYKVYP